MKTVLVTGGKGQLASAIKEKGQNLTSHKLIYTDTETLNIADVGMVTNFFDRAKFDFCVNCAAYTAVDKAESEVKLAEKTNVEGVKNLAKACGKHNTKFIHISTDFVFGGEKTGLYTEDDHPRPLGVYGRTKLAGEKEVSATLQSHFILRTSWLYSGHGHNFLKTMLNLGREHEELSVVCDQIGTPTFAGDLAEVILKIIAKDSTAYGTYHYSNEGVASWYDFAKAIFDIKKIDCRVHPILTENYPTPAKRPAFSVMDKTKIKREFKVDIPYWRDSLKICLQNNRDN